MSTVWVILGEEASIIGVINCISKIKPFINAYVDMFYSAESAQKIKEQVKKAKFSTKDYKDQFFNGVIEWEFIHVSPQSMITRADKIKGEDL